MSHHNLSYSQPQLPKINDPTLSNSFHSLKPLKSLQKFTNFTPSPSLKSSLLTHIKNRKKVEDHQIDPYLAAKVVKNYIIPMLEKTKIHNNDLNRKQIFGRSLEKVIESRDSTAESYVYKELKLSERLLKELEEMKIEVKGFKEKADICEQEKFELEQEIGYLKRINTELNVNLEMHKLQLNQKAKNEHVSEMKFYMVIKQLEHYKKLCAENQRKVGEYLEVINYEKNLNDIRLRNLYLP